ncbi:MAG: response regulator transcription factor [Planctomycetales bacterium]|nr:response regulator transcription factor [Planctomycetales bacterium]
MSSSTVAAGTAFVRTARIMIVDDHELVREGLQKLIDSQDNLQVCGQAACAKEARRCIPELEPDVVIVDLKLPDASGLELIAWIAGQRPECKVVVSSMHDEVLYGERVLRLGAMGYVSKESAARTILEAIYHALEGKYYFSKELIHRVLRRATGLGSDAATSPVAALSDRELEILTMLGQGLTTELISRRLFLSRNTVGTYRERLKVKLNLKNSTELTHFAVRWVADGGYRTGQQ